MQTEQNTATCNVSGEHESWALWRLCPELTIKQAALLIAGADPSTEEVEDERRHPSQWSPVYEAAKAALKAALRQDLIEGAIVPEYGEDYDGNRGAQIPGTVDIHLSTVKPESVRRYLEQRGFRRGFFFPDALSVPAYLDRTHPCYAPKLAAAIAAWEAAVFDPKYVNNGRHVKQNMEDFLTAHAAEYDLVKEDGLINYEAIRNQIAKVANFNEKGGAPKTPEGNPPRTEVTGKIRVFVHDIRNPPGVLVGGTSTERIWAGRVFVIRPSISQPFYFIQYRHVHRRLKGHEHASENPPASRGTGLPR